MKWLPLLLIFSSVVAQAAPNLKCGIRYKGDTKPMYWFEGGRSHHADPSFDLLSVRVQEKEDPTKVEIFIMEAAEDDVWDKLVQLADGSNESTEMKKKLKTLGRTRMTRIYLGLYDDLILYEHKLGADPNLIVISCVKSAQ